MIYIFLNVREFKSFKMLPLPELNGPNYIGDGSSVQYKYGKDHETNYQCVVQLVQCHLELKVY